MFLQILNTGKKILFGKDYGWCTSGKTLICVNSDFMDMRIFVNTKQLYISSHGIVDGDIEISFKEFLDKIESDEI